nr:hypothetical transcript [Hymenolepis microstoma]
MASLTDVLSWDGFKNENCFQSLDQYTQTLQNEYSVPSNFLDLTTTNDGVPFDVLSHDCLQKVFSVLSNLCEKSDWNPGYKSIFTFLCLITRRRENRSKLLVHEHLQITDKLLSHSIQQALSGSEHSREWSEVFDLGSKFIEWLFDPDLTWSTWLTKLHSFRLPPESVQPEKGNGYSSTWLRDFIATNSTRLPLDHLKRVLHLLCSEVAITTVTAWTALNQEVLASLMTAAIAADDEDPERFKLIIETVTFLLQRIFLMDENLREVEPTEAVKTFISVFANRKLLQPPDMLCISALLQTCVDFKIAISSKLSQILPIFQRSLQENNSLEFLSPLMGTLTLLTTEVQMNIQLPSKSDGVDAINRVGFSGSGGICRQKAIQCGLYTQISAILKKIILEPDSRIEDTRKILRSISSWADASAVVPLLDGLNSTVDKSQRVVLLQTIVDGNAFGIFVSLACELALSNNPQAIGEAFLCLEVAQEVLSNENSSGRKSLNEVCGSGFTRNVITPNLLRAFKRWDELVNDSSVEQNESHEAFEVKKVISQLIDYLLALLKIIGSYSAPLEDVAAIFALFRQDCMKNRSAVLLKTLASIIRPTKSPILGQPNGIFSWLEFENPTDSLLIFPSVEANNPKAMQRMLTFLPNSPVLKGDASQSPNSTDEFLYPSSTGLTFFMWVYFDSPENSKIPKIETERSCLLRMLSLAGNGIEAFMNSKGEFIVATAQAGVFHFATTSLERFSSRADYA